MDFENFVKQKLYNSDESKKNAFAKVLADKNQKIYVIGKNEQSRELVDKCHISGLIDDYSPPGSNWYGVAVFTKNDIAPDSIVVNCVTSISPVEVQKNLNAAGLFNVISVGDLISDSGIPLALPWFVSQQRQEIASHTDWWIHLNCLLADDVSKKTLLDVVRYRLTANHCFMSDYSVRLQDQYFEDFMGYKGEVFVDAGGFDGDSTEEFIKRYPDYEKIFFFEPSAKNLDAAKQRLGKAWNRF